jgi:natural product biosynthesis luciferase-like monooxygenase protein
VARPIEDIGQRIARLSAAQRAQLDELLRKKGLCLDDVPDNVAQNEVRDCADDTLGQYRDPPVNMEFSFMFFADNRSNRHTDHYHLLLEAARFADCHSIRSLWIPERHFHSFGGPYPNPSILAAAIATITRKVRIHAGSVVLPLHNPIRVAEEWSVVDNLSNGRVGIAFASGWHERDFVLAPGNYAERKQKMLADIDIVRALWRGEGVRVPSVTGGDLEVHTYPRPVQKHLPLWITSAGNVETFITAGRLGAHVLTGLTGQSTEELQAKISAYRTARERAGFAPGEGRVTLMLHAFIGDDEEDVRNLVRPPMREYLRNNLNLHLDLAKARRLEQSLPQFGQEDEAALLDFAFERYFTAGSLLGTAAKCSRTVRQLSRLGVNEIACLVDFGLPDEAVLGALPGIAQLSDTFTPTGLTGPTP